MLYPAELLRPSGGRIRTCGLISRSTCAFHHRNQPCSCAPIALVERCTEIYPPEELMLRFLFVQCEVTADDTIRRVLDRYEGTLERAAGFEPAFSTTKYPFHSPLVRSIRPATAKLRAGSVELSWPASGHRAGHPTARTRPLMARISDTFCGLPTGSLHASI